MEIDSISWFKDLHMNGTCVLVDARVGGSGSVVVDVMSPVCSNGHPNHLCIIDNTNFIIS